MMAERTSIYPTDEDKALLDRIEAQYGLKASTAYRTGLRLLAEALDGNRTTNHLKGEQQMDAYTWTQYFGTDVTPEEYKANGGTVDSIRQDVIDLWGRELTNEEIEDATQQLAELADL